MYTIQYMHDTYSLQVSARKQVAKSKVKLLLTDVRDGCTINCMSVTLFSAHAYLEVTKKLYQFYVE